MAKGEIARFEKNLLLSQCFQKSSAAEVSESFYMWERVITHKIPKVKFPMPGFCFKMIFGLV